MLPALTDQTVSSVDEHEHDAEIERLFGAEGSLSRAVGGFRPRQSQTDMAKAIADAVGQTVQTLGTFWVNVGTPSLTTVPGGSTASDPVLFLQNSLYFWTAALAVLSVLVGAAKMIIERRGAPLRDLARSLATLIVVSGAGVAAVGLLTVSAD